MSNWVLAHTAGPVQTRLFQHAILTFHDSQTSSSATEACDPAPTPMLALTCSHLPIHTCQSPFPHHPFFLTLIGRRASASPPPLLPCPPSPWPSFPTPPPHHHPPPAAPHRPQRPDAAVMVAAVDDAYVSLESVQAVHQYWSGSELRLVSGGHVSGFLLQQPEFRRAVVDSLAKL